MSREVLISGPQPSFSRQFPSSTPQDPPSCPSTHRPLPASAHLKVSRYRYPVVTCSQIRISTATGHFHDHIMMVSGSFGSQSEAVFGCLAYIYTTCTHMCTPWYLMYEHYMYLRQLPTFWYCWYLPRKHITYFCLPAKLPYTL